MHEGADGVAGGPCAQPSGVVAPLVGGEEPVVDRSLPWLLLQPQARLQSRQHLLAVRRPHHRDVGHGQRLLGGVGTLEHLTQRDGRHQPGTAAGETGEQRRVVPGIVTDEHPAHVRMALGQPGERGTLAGQARADEPARHQRPPARQHLAGRVAVPTQQTRDPTSQTFRKGGEVEHRSIGRGPGQRTQQVRHAQQRPAVTRAAGDQCLQPAQLPARGCDAQEPVDVVGHTQRRGAARRGLLAGVGRAREPRIAGHACLLPRPSSSASSPVGVFTPLPSPSPACTVTTLGESRSTTAGSSPRCRCATRCRCGGGRCGRPACGAPRRTDQHGGQQ